jgi:hypothetical protein
MQTGVWRSAPGNGRDYRHLTQVQRGSVMLCLEASLFNNYLGV